MCQISKTACKIHCILFYIKDLQKMRQAHLKMSLPVMNRFHCQYGRVDTRPVRSESALPAMLSLLFSDESSRLASERPHRRPGPSGRRKSLPAAFRQKRLFPKPAGKPLRPAFAILARQVFTQQFDAKRCGSLWGGGHADQRARERARLCRRSRIGDPGTVLAKQRPQTRPTAAPPATSRG
mgnify:CR=1 FL=1